jgi:hypothetical protein
MKTKTLSTLLSMVVLAFFVGCQPESEPGGPGATNGDAGDTQVRPEATFTLSLPDVSVTQGESIDATISLNSGSEFNQKVTVGLTAPAGLTVTPAEVTLTKDQAEQKFVVKADAEATLGAMLIDVAGTPETGKAVTAKLKVTVVAKPQNN